VLVIVSRDNYDLAVLWATVIATPLAAAGIFLAAWTIRSGNRDRRRVFELDVPTKGHLCASPAGIKSARQRPYRHAGPRDLPGLRQEIGRNTIQATTN
jgi:hypothetical protein